MAILRSFLVFILLVLLAAGCRPASETPPPALRATAVSSEPLPYVGSESCRECHQDFHELWSTSWHGLAMRPYTPSFGEDHLEPQQEPLRIGDREYLVEIDDQGGWVREIGPEGEKRYEMLHVLGGKNIFNFLTPMERGRLQVLPLGYDVHKQAWYDVAASGVRHFPDGEEDEALDWTDRMFTFNTTCFNCHVSQLATNYDLATDTYSTTWAEPGISCESCHGPAREHIRVFQEARDGEVPDDWKIIRTSEFTAQQMNDMCSTCHAKMTPISLSYLPGDAFFDHYDLVTLEHPDYYPDGRDLGENYTMTSWLMSPCVNSGTFDCNHCHTSSGRMRFEGPTINNACLPCHQEQVDDPVAHTRHPVGSGATECVACHMPMTRFAAMNRSDHSIRPPAPAATLAFGSPNACNLCHTDEDAAWADQWVRQWHGDRRQQELLQRAQLVDDARRGRWERLPEMLADIRDQKHDEVHRTTLVRLLRDCPDADKWPVIRQALQDPSPLVRSSAASALSDYLTDEVLGELLAATRDPVRLVRIRAAMALAPVRPEMITRARDRQSLERAIEEFKTAMTARPDDWSSHANVGNFYMERRDFSQAAKHYGTASQLEPRAVGPLVNAAIAYSNLDQNAAAEKRLRRALDAEPENAAVNLNLGLLLAEQGQLAEAERALRTAIASDPQMAQAAYNLAVIAAERGDISQAIQWCRTAHQLRPGDPRYAHTLAYYQHQDGETAEAIGVLRQLIEREPGYWDAYLLLGEIYERAARYRAAADLYRDALSQAGIPPRLQHHLQVKLLQIRDSE